MRKLLVAFAITALMSLAQNLEAADDPAAFRAYQQRLASRRHEALAHRATIKSSKPPAVYFPIQGFRGIAGVDYPGQMHSPVILDFEWVYDISLGRNVPSGWQRRVYPAEYVGGFQTKQGMP